MLRQHAMKLGFGRAEEKIAGGDGAEWIWNQMRLNFPMVEDALLDFYHLSENIFKAAWQLYGEGSAAGRRWAMTNMRLAKYHGGTRLLQTLERSRHHRKKRTARDGRFRTSRRWPDCERCCIAQDAPMGRITTIVRRTPFRL
jgi:hypothetical protein